MKTCDNDGEENSSLSGAVENPSMRGEGQLLSPAASSGPNNGGRSVVSLRSGEDMVPTTSTGHF